VIECVKITTYNQHRSAPLFRALVVSSATKSTRSKEPTRSSNQPDTLPYDEPLLISSRAICTCCHVELLRQELTGHLFPSISSAIAACAAGAQLGLFSSRVTMGCSSNSCFTVSLLIA
jgi:hypothetical protein